MEIHKPHAAKTWKEFFIELGTIVVGILIALGLEQMVEGLHDRSRVAQARENIRSEIAANIGIFVTRDGTESCVSRRLDEVDGLIHASTAGSLPPGPIWIGHPFLSARADNQYMSATQSGAVALMPSQEQSSYALIYVEFDQYHQAALNEQSAWADLRTLANHPVSSPVLDWQLRSAMQKARTARFQMETAEHQIRTNTARLEIKPSAAPLFRQQSTCIPLNTPRAEAEEKELNGGRSGVRYDIP
jgi:hypothetical protein